MLLIYFLTTDTTSYRYRAGRYSPAHAFFTGISICIRYLLYSIRPSMTRLLDRHAPSSSEPSGTIFAERQLHWFSFSGCSTAGGLRIATEGEDKSRAQNSRRRGGKVEHARDRGSVDILGKYSGGKRSRWCDILMGCGVSTLGSDAVLGKVIKGAGQMASAISTGGMGRNLH
jgi:hypothetical protein